MIKRFFLEESLLLNVCSVSSLHCRPLYNYIICDGTRMVQYLKQHPLCSSTKTTFVLSS